MCLLFVPWHCLAPLLTQQTKVTQPLSRAYSHTAYLLSVWCVVGCVLPRQSEDPLWRELSLCGSMRYSNCIMVAACPVQSLSPTPHSNRVYVQAEEEMGGCTPQAQTSPHTPMSSPRICSQWSFFFFSFSLPNFTASFF